MTGAPGDQPGLLPRAAWFPRHFRIFLGVVLVAIMANAAFGLGLPLFWPIGAWTVLLAIHYLVASTLSVEQDWVDEKAEDLRMRSYDFGHIDEIRDRAARHEDSLTHPTERRRPKDD